MRKLNIQLAIRPLLNNRILAAFVTDTRHLRLESHIIPDEHVRLHCQHCLSPMLLTSYYVLVPIYLPTKI